MRSGHIQHLTCPECGAVLEWAEAGDAGISHGVLKCALGHIYPAVNGIPRFVDAGNYADSFGFQWNKFSKVQLDTYNETGFSEERFRAITGWGENDLAGKLVLDAGCGAGRFAEVVVNKYRANLIACDLSSAVEACRENLAPADPLVCQASIYRLPFRKSHFDFVYCIGVIQHTPDPFGAIRALCKLVKPGGQIGLWIYEFNWKSLVGTLGFKYLLRPVVKRLPRNAQWGFCKLLVELFYPIVAVAKRARLPGKIVMRLLPIASAHLQSVKLSPADFKAWVFLDTFDMYTPAFDKPQRYSSIARLLEEEGFCDIQRHPHGAIAITATRRG